jgi:hypothetical protein
MEYRLLDDASVAQVLYHDPLEERGSDSRVPDSFRVNRDDRPPAAHTEARSLRSLHAGGSEQKPFTFQ